MPRGAKEEGHKSAHRSAGHRLQREAGAIQVGGGANSVLGEPLPAAEGTLRAPRRHPPSVSRPWVCSDLLALCSAVMLGALRRSRASTQAHLYAHVQHIVVDLEEPRSLRPTIGWPASGAMHHPAYQPRRIPFLQGWANNVGKCPRLRYAVRGHGRTWRSPSGGTWP